MPAPYSNDLRKKVLSAVDRGEKKSHICKIFNISRNTLDLWLKRRDYTGNISPKRDCPPGPKPIIKDLQKFEIFVRENSHLTQKEMAKKWEIPVSSTTISKALKKINFTRKNKLIHSYNSRKKKDN